MTLRTRLLGIVAMLAALALVAVGTVTYLELRGFLYSQVDRTVSSSVDVLGDHLSAGQPLTASELDSLVSATPGVYVGDLGPGRTVRWHALGVEPGTPAAPAPALAHIGAVSDNEADEPPPITVGAVRGSLQYRVAIEPVGTSQAVLLAAPLDGVQDTLSRLLAIEIAISIAVLVVLVGIAGWSIAISLRPLTRIERTATAIAGGDLSHRVPERSSTTEVDRLAAAFNAMVDRIEGAFSEQAESERVLRRFVADASHELRTPLAAVRAYAELFARGAKYRPDDLERAMTGIQHETARMTVLVDDLLLLARLDQHREVAPRDTDLVVILRAAADASQAIDSGHPIALEAPDALMLKGDPQALRRMVDNLLGNVRAHTPPGTPTTLCVRAEPGQAVLEVADEGPGLPADLAPHAFERFARGDASRSRAAGGSGLGLAIVEAIAAAHGGIVRLDNAPGRGATFTVTLPLA